MFALLLCILLNGKGGANAAVKSKMKSRRQDEMDRGETEGKGRRK